MKKNDTVIKDLLAKVEQQKKDLGKKPRNVLSTNGLFKFEGQSFNINTVSVRSDLVDFLAFLISKEKAYGQACDRLGVTCEFRCGGYTTEEWEQDFQNRISVLDFNDKKKLLDSTQKRLDTLVSSEAKTEMELDRITAQLAG
jgi:hypothetical protein